MRHQEYNQLFEAIAESNKSFRHNIDGRKNFARITLSAWPEAELQIMEFLSGVRNTFSFSDDQGRSTPIMLLQNAENTFNDNRADNILKIKNGAFIILYTYQAVDDFNHQEYLLDAAEARVEEVLSYLKEYFKKHARSGTSFEMSATTTEDILLPEFNMVGMRCNIVFRKAVNSALAIDPAKWSSLP